MAAHKAWRLLVTANNGSANTHLAEFGLLVSSVNNSTNTGSAYATSELGPAYTADKAFDATPSTFWHRGTGVELPMELGKVFDTAIDVDEIFLQAPGSPQPTANQPKDFSVQYSDDTITNLTEFLNATWVTVSTFTGETGWAFNELRSFSVAPPATGHVGWRINVSVPSGAASWFHVAELVFKLGITNQTLEAGSNFATAGFQTTPDNAFDASNATIHTSTASGFPAHVGRLFTVGQDVDNIDITATPSGAFAGTRSPGDFTIEYSDDTTDGTDGTWVIASTFTGETGWTASELRNFTITTGGVTLVPNTATTAFDTLINIDVLTNDVGIVGGEVLTVASQPANGTAAVNGDGVTIDYTPNGVFTGDDTFTYDVDASGSPALVTVTVTGTAGFSGPIDENLAITSWDVHAFSLDGTVHLKTTSTASTYQIATTQDVAYVITGLPTIDLIWEEGTAVTAGDYMTSPTIGHVWIAQNTGTTKAGAEPPWNLSGNTTDNDITWNYIDELPRPSSQGPIKPGLF